MRQNSQGNYSLWISRFEAYLELVLYTYPENVTSCKMLSKIGFHKEGLLRGYIHQGNKQHDALLYSIVRTDVEVINL